MNPGASDAVDLVQLVQQSITLEQISSCNQCCSAIPYGAYRDHCTPIPLHQPLHLHKLIKLL